MEHPLQPWLPMPIRKSGSTSCLKSPTWQIYQAATRWHFKISPRDGFKADNKYNSVPCAVSGGTTTDGILPFVADDNREASISDKGDIIAFISTRNLVGTGNSDGNPELFFASRQTANWSSFTLAQGTNTQDDAILRILFVGSSKIRLSPQTAPGSPSSPARTWRAMMMMAMVMETQKFMWPILPARAEQYSSGDENQDRCNRSHCKLAGCGPSSES